MQRLHHEGTRFINENGNEVILHGINVLHNMHQDLFREGTGEENTCIATVSVEEPGETLIKFA